MTLDVWDGVWTYDLLRDLCGGVTREAGAFQAARYRMDRRRLVYAGKMGVERSDRVKYRLLGEWLSPDEAVARLNELFAVPFFDDGREWKVRRPDPAELAAKCAECRGTGEVECGSCDDGRCECSCGHEHDCHECDGSGMVACEACEACQPAGVS